MEAASNILQEAGAAVRRRVRDRLDETESRLAVKRWASVRRSKSKREAAAGSARIRPASSADAVPLDAAQVQRLDGWRAEALGEHQLSVESCDNREQEVRKWLQDRIDAEDKRLARADGAHRQCHARASRRSSRLETVEMDVSLAALREYERMLDGFEA